MFYEALRYGCNPTGLIFHFAEGDALSLNINWSRYPPHWPAFEFTYEKCT